MKHSKKEKRQITWKQTFRMLRQLNVPWLWVFGNFLAWIGYNQFLLNMPSITADLAAGDLSAAGIWRAVGIYAGSYAVSMLLSCTGGMANHTSVRNARRVIWDKMLHIRLDYYDSNNPSEMMSTMLNDIAATMGLVVSVCAALLPNIYYVIVALKKVGTFHILLMLAVFAIFPLKILYMLFFGKWNYRTQVGVYSHIGNLTGYLSERIKHLSLIKTNTNVPKELENGESTIAQLYKANVGVEKYKMVSQAASVVITVIQNFVIVVLGVICLQRGLIDVKQWVAFFLFASTLYTKFDSLISNWLSIKMIQGGLARTARLMDAPQENIADSAAKREMPATKDILFENVSFAYGEKKALKNVSFTVPENTLTAIVGLCGSGKTTSLNLTEGFYQAQSGAVRIGNVDVRDISPEALRKNIALVHQGAGIFSGTIREALCYGVERPLTDEEILQAAEITGAKEYIDKCADGLDTAIAAEGTSMSGGQRQRLVLTRELLRQTGMMLLDEPTAALDAVTADKIKQVIQTMSGGKTVVMVTHDLSLVDIADQIIVMNEGVIEGCGTYSQLMNSCQLFKAMVNTQRRTGLEENAQ